MGYENLRKVFHTDARGYEQEYQRRFSDPHAVRIDMPVSGFPAFISMVPELYDLMLEAARADKDILVLERQLPGMAIASYTDSLLIDEIVLTNEIEGVNSTRREVGEVLERLKANDKKGRFSGIVQKYRMLQQKDEIPLTTCEDIRLLYDDLVLDEVMADNADNAPDGELFRVNPVHVVDQTGRSVHDGLDSEAQITAALGIALPFLHDESVPALVRLSAFHFLFGYIHPFYDGNGRTNRFISSYMMTREYEAVTSLALSYAVKSEIRKYYKAYSVTEHELNRGDLTPFVIAFAEIVVSAMTGLRDSLAERERAFRDYCGTIVPAVPSESRAIAEALVTGTLFTFNGLTAAHLVDEFGISRQTVYKRLAPIKRMGLLVAEKVGHKTYYRLKVDDA